MTRGFALWIGIMSAGWAGVVDFTIVDRGKVVPARVLIQGGGKDWVPAGAVEVPIGPDKWFVSDGQVKVEVGASRVRVLVERGTEYRTAVVEMDAGSSRRIELARWIDMKARGWRSGECHLHMGAAELGPMLAAEDLDFGNSLYWWNGPKLKLPEGARPVMDLQFGGHSAPTSIFDAEVENPWGAVYLIGLREPVQLPWVRPRSNVAFIDWARKQGAFIAYQGGWSREVLVDALTGGVDAVNLCNNNFHRFKYQPRPQYSNLLEVEGLPEFPATADGMMHLNFDSYYRLLNCGLRLAAGAESATGAKTTPVGYNRSYVQGAKTYAEYLQGWKAGRNFVTNGPMIFLTPMPGEVLKGGPVRVKAEVFSDQPLDSLELVANGEVIKRAKIEEGAKHAEVSMDVPARESMWIAARSWATEPLLSDEERERFAIPGKSRGGEKPTRLRFAHTSPVYVEVGGKPVRVERSVSEARRMLDAFERYARKTAGEGYLDEVLARVAAARHSMMK